MEKRLHTAFFYGIIFYLCTIGGFCLVEKDEDRTALGSALPAAFGFGLRNQGRSGRRNL